MRKNLLVFAMLSFCLIMAACGKKDNLTSDSSVTSAQVTEAVAESEKTETAASEDSSEDVSKNQEEAVKYDFEYLHDPRIHEDILSDVIIDPYAVYGFSPNPESTRLGAYAEYDWGDPAVVEAGRADRIAYHESIESMYEMLDRMIEEGNDIETIARALSAERNRIRLAAYDDDPDGLLKVKESNLAEYGDENGPTADSLYEKYGSWEKVLEKAFSVNVGMDLCLGLYDDYYKQYLELGVFNNVIDDIIENNSADIFGAKIKEFTDSLSIPGLLGISKETISKEMSALIDLDGYEIVSEKLTEDGLYEIELDYSNKDLIKSAMETIGMENNGVNTVKMNLTVKPDSYEVVDGQAALVTANNEITIFKY